jgi:hypothetical protein
MKRTFSFVLYLLLVGNTFAHVKFEGVELTGAKQTFVEKLHSEENNEMLGISLTHYEVEINLQN